jgi:hypothetical protein
MIYFKNFRRQIGGGLKAKPPLRKEGGGKKIINHQSGKLQTCSESARFCALKYRATFGNIVNIGITTEYHFLPVSVIYCREFNSVLTSLNKHSGLVYLFL